MDKLSVKCYLKDVFPAKIWSCRPGIGAFLTFDCAKRKRQQKLFNRVQYYYRGSVHLWIYMCKWRLRQKKDVLLTSEDDLAYGRSLSTLRMLNQKSILDIVEQNKRKNKITHSDLLVEFSDDYFLDVSAEKSFDDDNDLLMIFSPSRSVLSYSIAKRFYWGE